MSSYSMANKFPYPYLTFGDDFPVPNMTDLVERGPRGLMYSIIMPGGNYSMQ